jgi:hypothetical protein
MSEGIRTEIDEGVVMELRQLLVLVSPLAVSFCPQESTDIAQITVYLESSEKAGSTLFEAFHKFPAMLNMFQEDIESIRTQNETASIWCQDILSMIDVLSSIQVPLSEEACPLEEACPRFVEAVDKLAQATASYYDKKNDHFVHLFKEENICEAARFKSTESVAMESIVNCGAATMGKMCESASKGEYLEDAQRTELRQGFEKLEGVAQARGDTTRFAQLSDMLIGARAFEQKLFADDCASVNDSVLAKEMTEWCENQVKRLTADGTPQGAAIWLQNHVLPILYGKLEGLCRVPRDETNSAVAPCQDYLQMLCKLCKQIRAAETPTEADMDLEHKALKKVIV